MNEALDRLRDITWISGATTCGLLVLLLFLTVWRNRWLRLLEWETRLWERWGVSPRFLAVLRKFEERKWLLRAVVFLFLLHLTLTVVSAAAYHHFSKEIKQRQRSSASDCPSCRGTLDSWKIRQNGQDETG